jgi:hypothetical protein
MNEKPNHKAKGILYITPVFMQTYIYFIGEIELIGDLADVNLMYYGKYSGTKYPLFKWHHKEAVQYILSENKKIYRQEHLKYDQKDSFIIDRELTVADCFRRIENGSNIVRDVIDTMVKRKRGAFSNNYESVDIEITDIRCLHVNICPSTGRIWMPPGYKNSPVIRQEYVGKHLFKFKRMPLEQKTHVIKRNAQLVESLPSTYMAGGIVTASRVCYHVASEEVKKINTFLSGDLLKEEYIEYHENEPKQTRKKDPRWFLYSKEEPITEKEIIQSVCKRIKKVMKVRAIKAAEKLFFQSIVGLKELTKLIKTQTT